jgi:hypothetical protein
MRAMTGRERYEAIFRGRIPDRPAVKLWGCDTARRPRHIAFEPVRDLALRTTDLVFSAWSPFSLYAGQKAGEVTQTTRRPSGSPDWLEQVTVLRTPLGDLEEVVLVSTGNRPGYHKTYFLKEPADIRKLLSLPYEPYPVSADNWQRREAEVGDRGFAMFGLDHAMYGLQRLIGSESFALWSWEAEELMLEAMTCFAGRLLDHARQALAAGVRGVYGWVGPELCIPPLMSPAHFDRYVTALDKPLIDLIHEGGGHVWVHCHGRMGPVLERFADLGVDVLNPIEPPPMGDLSLEQAFGRVGNRLGLEGNIETHDLMTGTPDALRPKIAAALEAGRGRRFIFCPSSGYDENVEPSRQEILNWRFYLQESVIRAEAMRE